MKQSVYAAKGFHSMEKNKRTFIITMVIIFFMLLFSLCFLSKTVMAQRSHERSKLVTTVRIEDGDTLWSIATLYYTDEFDNINEYIEEIKYSNGLESDTIHKGNYIIVPYYEESF